MRTAAVIQCHHVGWEGTTDVSLREDPDGRRVIEQVMERAKRLPDLVSEPVIACPDEPENRIFAELAEAHGCACFFGSTADVLDRLASAGRSVGAERLAWVQGIHYFLDVDLMGQLLSWAETRGFDYARCSDGSLKHVLGQVLTLDAIERSRSLIDSLETEDRAFFKARPFAFMRSRPDDFKLGLFEQLPGYDDATLRRFRGQAESIYVEGRALHTEKAKPVGDVSIGRYREVLDRVQPGMRVLDIACGTGFGSRLVAELGAEVVGVDIESETVALATERHGDLVDFRLGRAEQIPLGDHSVDLAFSIGTIEHVEDDSTFIRELNRVLRPGGAFIAYTPQNRMGHIPIWPHHVREYSIDGLKAVAEPYFTVERIAGWQNGILTLDDPRGDGSYLFANAR
ncbi:MAG: methyltransferase domain-containing protein [Acidobacteriota bacterium]